MNLLYEQTEKLIELFRDTPCLWNSNDADYRHNDGRSASLARISSVMNLPVGAFINCRINLKASNKEKSSLTLAQ
jgi:hypothetical protein